MLLPDSLIYPGCAGEGVAGTYFSCEYQIINKGIKYMMLTQQDGSTDMLNPITDLQTAYTILSDTLNNWATSAIESLPNLVVAILIITVFSFLSYFVQKVSMKVLSRVFEAPQISSLFSSIIRVVVLWIGIFIALEIVGLSGTVTSLLAGAGIVGLAIGFAFQDMTENFIAGVAMGIRKPFKIGDVIESEQIFGTVVAINLRNTIVETFSGQYDIVPNKHLFRSIVTNYNATGRRKIEITVGIPYDQNIEQAVSLIKQGVNQLEFISNKDDTLVFTDSFAASSIDLKVWFWIRYPKGVGYIDARHQGFVAIKRALDKANISIPFPIRTLDFDLQDCATRPDQLERFNQRDAEN